jgi:hypothetical protein
MKAKWKGLFSLSINESDYFNHKQCKFELVGGCPRDRSTCIKHLSVLNKSFALSQCHHLNKDYPRSIESLKYAYDITDDFQESSCENCVTLFRSTIIQSLEYIHEDLQKMSSGFIRTKQYIQSFVLASQVLEDFRKEK